MFKDLVEINRRPEPFQFYTANELWTEEHTANQMLAYHLNDEVDASSRNSKFIEKSVEWIVSHFHVDKNTAIADFGCGPGLYANRLAERGATVTGIDFSDNSLRYARKIAADYERVMGGGCAGLAMMSGQLPVGFGQSPHQSPLNDI